MVNRIFSFLALALLSISMVPSAHAAAVSAVPVHVDFTVGNILSSTWFEIYTSTLKSVKGITIGNKSSVSLKVAIGAAGSEVAQLTIPPNASFSVPVFYPIVLSQAQRISVQSSGSTGGSGSADFNFFFN